MSGRWAAQGEAPEARSGGRQAPLRPSAAGGPSLTGADAPRTRGFQGGGADAGWLLAVGSNLGDRAAHLAAARAAIAASGLAAVVDVGGAEETAPVGGPAGQGAYLNDVWLLASRLGPHQLLALLWRIEDALGRTRVVRWGARTIDLDLLARLDGLRVATPALVLPHPRAAERPFVLRPLARLAARHPAVAECMTHMGWPLAPADGALPPSR